MQPIIPHLWYDTEAKEAVAFFYHLSSLSRYLMKNILCLVIQIRKLFYFGLKFRVKKSTRN